MRIQIASVLACCLFVCSGLPAGQRSKVAITSTADGTAQPCYVIIPDQLPQDAKVPLLVSLHTWSNDLEQRNRELELLVEQKGWIYLFPNFRGANRHPEACGSVKSQQDILDAVAWARQNYPIDERRIYLTGVSGGGHMTMLMVGRHPHIWAAASAWVGISDLAAWHTKHADGKYGAMLRACCGGAPGDGPEVDREYRQRSPLTWLPRAKDVPLDIAAGIHDGHQGSVPIRHSLEAFNTIASAVGEPAVTAAEIQQLSQPRGRLADPQTSDQAKDQSLGRQIHLRRTAGRSRVTIFEGGHEGIASAAIAWLESHVKE